MLTTDVIDLLGEPGDVTVGSYGQMWYFPNALGGSVKIDKFDKVEGWSEPSR